MKTQKNLYEQIYDYETLYNAYLEARKNKRYRDEVLVFTANLEEELINLQNHLIHQSYEVGRYKEVIVRIPKKRIILILPFRDRVMQWAIYSVLRPLFERTYITDTYGCIKGRGDLAAARRIQYWLRQFDNDPRTPYVLMMDIRKYFFRIPHDVIIRVLRKKIADERMMWLLELIVRSRTTPFGLPVDAFDVENTPRIWGIGIPVGSLFSQLVANIVLNELDQYVKRSLRIKHYIRYMDNSLIFGYDKSELHRIKAQIERFLHEELGLEFSNASIHKANTGIEFAGFRIWSDKLHIRKSTTLQMKRRLKRVRALYTERRITLEKAISIFQSYRGMLSHCDNKSLVEKVHEDFVLTKSWSEDWPE